MFSKRLICEIAFTLVLATSAFAGEQTARDVAYSGATAAASRDNMLDIEFDPDTVRPLVVFIHGGGWSHGDKNGARWIAPTFFGAGYSFAAVNYRLSPHGTVADAAKDLAEAIGFLRSRAAQFMIDPDRITLIGFSAGAHLAALVATDSSLLRAAGVPFRSIRAVVLLDGAAFDTVGEVAGGPGSNSLAVALGTNPNYLRQVSPLEHLATASELPPFCIYYDPDRLVSAHRALPFAQALREHGAYVSTKGYEHFQHVDFARKLSDPNVPFTQDVLSCIAPQQVRPRP
jgi:arylformamidase